MSCFSKSHFAELRVTSARAGKGKCIHLRMFKVVALKPCVLSHISRLYRRTLRLTPLLVQLCQSHVCRSLENYVTVGSLRQQSVSDKGEK